MNATEQRQRHTAVTRLAGEVETVLDDYSKRTGDGIKAAISTCCAYTDDAALKVRGICDARDAQTRRDFSRISTSHYGFIGMTFWQRWRWLFTGRV